MHTGSIMVPCKKLPLDYFECSNLAMNDDHCLGQSNSLVQPRENCAARLVSLAHRVRQQQQHKHWQHQQQLQFKTNIQQSEAERCLTSPLSSLSSVKEATDALMLLQDASSQ